MLIAGLYLLHFDAVMEQPLDNHVIFACTAGATLVIIAVLQSVVAERLLDNRVGATLGFLSFPIYVVHVPIICSAASAAYMALSPAGTSWALTAAVTCVATLALIAAWPLAMIDARWVSFLNAQAKRLINPEQLERGFS